MDKQTQPFSGRDKWEYILRLSDFWLTAALVNYWGSKAGYLHTKWTSVQTKYGPEMKNLYESPWLASMVVFLALAAGYLVYRIGLSSRVLLRQSRLYTEREDFRTLEQSMQRWVEADGFGNLQEPFDRVIWAPVLCGTGFLFFLASFSHMFAMIVGLVFCVFAYLNFPSHVIDVDPETHIFRHCYNYGGLRWYRLVSAEPIVCVTVEKKEKMVNKGLTLETYYAIEVVDKGGTCIRLLDRETALPLLDEAQLKAKNWAEALHLPLRLPECGFVVSGDDVLGYPAVDLAKIGAKPESQETPVEIEGPIKVTAKWPPDPEEPKEEWTSEA